MILLITNLLQKYYKLNQMLRSAEESQDYLLRRKKVYGIWVGLLSKKCIRTGSRWVINPSRRKGVLV
jgi:hypothetical protein